MNAISFVNRASDTTKFEICIDNEWFYDCDKSIAIKTIVDYETKTSAEFFNGKENWNADVMRWFVSTSDANTVVMEVL